MFAERALCMKTGVRLREDVEFYCKVEFTGRLSKSSELFTEYRYVR